MDPCARARRSRPRGDLAHVARLRQRALALHRHQPVRRAEPRSGRAGGARGRAGSFVAFFVAVAFLGPIVEELMFRGLGYRLFEPYGRWTAILVTSLVFGL